MAQAMRHGPSKWQRFKHGLDRALGIISPLAILGSGRNLWQDSHASPVHLGVIVFDSILLLGWILIFVGYYFVGTSDGAHESRRIYANEK